ncbi:uncharacterized protein LOC113233742 isoform X1 [Hyposmocoma kahamanoa]|uniref:uncharacterized protein LOC113233742 isoform X1 n=1 Tax=Hyposmocoma kahamanoa TaxID=1477025 RepID=UPI000E6D61A2|nr:uncharacterized protein LOC113233742 isoform X1 [Hyposmocoma kahamanoa]
MYAAAGGASLAGRKARQHGRQPAPSSPSTPVHPAPTGVRAYSCQHWESRLLAPPSNVHPPRPLSALSEPHSPCDVVEVYLHALRSGSRGVAGGGGAVGRRRRRRGRRRSAQVLCARRPPGRTPRPQQQMAEKQSSTRRVIRFIIGLRRGAGRHVWGAMGRCTASVCWTRHACRRTCCLLRWHRGQGFQNASTAVGGPVADCGWVGVLPAANRLLYLRQTLLPPPDQLQGEQKTGWVWGGRGDAVGSWSEDRSCAVLASTSPGRVVLRRVKSLQWRGGRAFKAVPHRRSTTSACLAFRTCSSAAGRSPTNRGARESRASRCICTAHGNVLGCGAHATAAPQRLLRRARR